MVVGASMACRSSQRSNGRERGTAFNASTSASGCASGGEPLMQHAVDRLEPFLGHVRGAVGSYEAFDAAVLEAVREAVPAFQAGVAVGAKAGVMSTRPLTRSG